VTESGGAHAHRVLLVEDDGDVREALAAVLEHEGYPVLEAQHGRDALDKLRDADDICLILLDLFMPTMNGWAFREAQVKDPAIAGIPVVVVSAGADLPRHIAKMGVVAAVAKPIDFDRLLQLVGQYC